MGRSLAQGEIVPVGPDAPPTLCDALQTPRVSPITFSILQQRRARALSVSDRQVMEAIRWAWREHRITIEPGGAAALAALLSGKADPVEGTVVVLSGGNIDPELHSRIVEAEA
jgi:threonine dehydratase